MTALEPSKITRLSPWDMVLIPKEGECQTLIHPISDDASEIDYLSNRLDKIMHIGL